MKITKRQLRRIIKEEKRKLVEVAGSTLDDEPYIRKMEEALNDFSAEGATEVDLLAVLEQLISNVKDGWYEPEYEEEY
jgi:hypothetical protein